MQVQKKLDFYVDKTVAEHLALMDGVLAALELRVPRVQAFTDSDLVYDQVIYLGRCKINVNLHL